MVREKSGNFEQSGQVWEFYQNTGIMRELYPKYWKSEDFLASFYFYFVVFVKFIK